MAAGTHHRPWAPSVGAAIGVGGMIASLTAFSGTLLVFFSVAVVIALLPLIGRWPLPRRRVTVVACCWMAVGLPTFIFGGALLAVAACPLLMGAGIGWGNPPVDKTSQA